MLELPNVTLLSIDTVDPQRSIRSMRYSLLQVKFAEAVLVTSQVFRGEMLKTIGGRGRIDQIRVVFVAPGPRQDYERQIVEDLPKWFETEFCLFQEWDSAVMNPSAWEHQWISISVHEHGPRYDFIGAPWPYSFQEPGYPPCIEENCVGNGGFSLRSRRFCQATGELYRNLGMPKAALHLSDAWISRTIRPQLVVNYGMQFAPESEALRFSCENRFYNGQFGLHGKNTIKMNGLDWEFKWLI